MPPGAAWTRRDLAEPPDDRQLGERSQRAVRYVENDQEQDAGSGETGNGQRHVTPLSGRRPRQYEHEETGYQADLRTAADGGRQRGELERADQQQPHENDPSPVANRNQRSGHGEREHQHQVRAQKDRVG